jgi:FkbM family methyltransferase
VGNRVDQGRPYEVFADSALAKTLAHQVAVRRHALPLRATAWFARAFLHAQGNCSYDVELNGERRVLEVLGRFTPGCIFDVGANLGTWTRLAHDAAPGAEIHCFEIVPDTAGTLQQTVGELQGVTVNAVGLGDRSGSVIVRHYPERPVWSGIDPLDRPSLRMEPRECSLTTGDIYCAERSIDHIDLLKIDAEGAEPAVLKGFSRMLDEARIAAVQFEYGFGNIRAHFLLSDFYDFFEPAGFAVGKIFPDGVEFRAYDIYRDEDFLGPNYLAVRRERTDLLAALRGGS